MVERGVIYRLDPLTAGDYDEAIRALQDAKTQLEPDGRGCIICHDTGHQAMECHHNPLVMARRAAREKDFWRCFHCNATFALDETDAAEEHFGVHEDIPAACQRSGKDLSK